MEKLPIKQQFEHGVYGMLHVDWTLQLQTPLTIHNGMKAAYKQQDPHFQKGRGMQKDFKWQDADKLLSAKGDKKTGWSQVADFNYHFAIAGQHVSPEYAIPASSIRGTLRHAAITAFVERTARRDFMIPKKAESEDSSKKAERKHQIDRTFQHLENQRSGWYNLLSLFGCAFDIEDAELKERLDDPAIWAGRLRLTTKLAPSANPGIDGIDPQKTAHDGPQNLKRHIIVRNPLDRVTAAAKEGGLHFSMEMSEGESFAVHFEILNPHHTDIGLLATWYEDIDAGFLRFGALTSQGRGRASITKETYTLYWSADRALAKQLNDLPKEDLFHEIWKGADLTLEQLQAFGLP
jgi:CRISPR/Cas system CSM-associated protein Csm3 (group 7 of RAMP superfamily)